MVFCTEKISQTIEFNANVNFTYYDSLKDSLAIVSGWGAVDVIHLLNIILNLRVR
jgi:hypothetical protein